MATASQPADDAVRTVDADASAARAPTADGRLLDIDRAKGFGIALVVWGHIASAATLGSPTWFYVSVGAIYTFHMPLFMYLSGFVFFLIGAPDRFWRAPGGFVGKRFDRLIVPFLAFGLVAVVGKYVAASIGPTDDGVEGIGNGIVRVLTNAPGNPSLSIWYILVLFVYSVATPVLWRLGGRRLSLLLLLGAIGWALPVPEEYYLRRIAIFYIFFVIGGAVALHRDRVFPLIERWYLPLLAIFAVVCFLTIDSPYALLVCGIACLPGLHGLFRQRFFDRDRIFLTLGRYSMAIYLLNTIAIGAAKILYLRVLPYQGAWFPVYALTMLAIGIGGPMLARIVIGYVRPLRPLKRYLD